MIRRDDIKRIVRDTILNAPLDHGFVELVAAINARIDEYFALSEPWVVIYDRNVKPGVSRRYLVKNTETDEFHSSHRDKKIIRYEFENSAKAVAKRLNNK